MNRLIDHTLLKATATASQIEKLCLEAKEHEFKSVCVNPVWVSKCADLLKGTNTVVCTVIGFPLGANTSSVKAFEAKEAIEHGASEVDMVINVGALKANDVETVYQDIQSVRDASIGKILKVIIETCYLTKEEIVVACQCAMRAKADFVKTSTGFGTGGAKVEDVSLMAKTVDGVCLVKASGGIHSYDEAKQMVDAGASRIGTSSGIDIMKGAKHE